jgi:hypothetical protein
VLKKFINWADPSVTPPDLLGNMAEPEDGNILFLFERLITRPVEKGGKGR